MERLVTEARLDKLHRNVILVVEADFLTRWSAAEYLRETGFDVIEAVSAAEALAAIRCDSAIDSILCDAAALSCEQGAEFLRCLEERHPNLPMLIASESRDGADPLPRTGTRLGVAKPYVMSDVEPMLRAVITRS